MKRQSTNLWSEIFSAKEVEIIQFALTFFKTEDASDSKIQNRENIASILEHINVDYETIVAAILLIGLQSGDFTQEDIAVHFTTSIVDLTLQSLSLIVQENDWVEQVKGGIADNESSAHHMMLLNMMEDARVVFIILANQVLKMQNLDAEPKAVQIKVAQETKNIFAPLANRLGIGQLKWELEDLAFRYLEPTEYKNIANSLEERRVDRENYMLAIVEKLQYKLFDVGLDCEVQGRAKHIFSIWKKMQQKQLAFSDLYDVRAVRVLVDDLSSCYTVLSIVHGLWEYVPTEYDDYVAAPKSNNYQSLHTAVIGPDGKTVEIQIRTYEMHAHAELGVAAHWRYKEGARRDNDLEAQLESLRNVLNQNDTSVTILEKPTRIYVLSPKGHVVELPNSSTPLDFAYHIHSEVGHKCRGAKVNGKMVALTTTLRNGQIVEIITAKEGKPSRDWLVPHFGYLKSSRAKSKVRTWFKREFREEHIASGKTALMKEVSILPSNTTLKNLTETFNMRHLEDLYAAIGRGELGVHQVLNSLKIPEASSKEDRFSTHESVHQRNKSDVIIEGVDDLMTSLARCCKPLPGDPVVGFITQGRGVTIHRDDCPNVNSLTNLHPQRMINVSWGGKSDQSYEVDIEVIALDRSGLLRDVMSVLSGQSINVSAANTYTDKNLQQARMRLTLEVSEPQQLTLVLSKLINLRGIFEASRIK